MKWSPLAPLCVRTHSLPTIHARPDSELEGETLGNSISSSDPAGLVGQYWADTFRQRLVRGYDCDLGFRLLA